MKTEHVESMDELVFYNKNKLYGAYLLRRKYNRHLVVSLLFGLFVIFSAISYPLIAAYLSPVKVIIGSDHTGNYDPMKPAPVEPPPPPPSVIEPVVPDRIRFLTPKVVDKELETEMIPQGEMESQPALPLPRDNGEIVPVDDNSKNTIEQPVAPPEPWISVEEMPQFPGGEAELFRFLAGNLRYPPDAKEIGVTGRVFIYFVVEPDGSISGISVRRGIGSGCDEEAMRVVALMPKWSPGKQGGIPVRVQYTLPVKFVLQ